MTGALGGVPFTASTMLLAGGGFCVGISKAALTAAGAAVGDVTRQAKGEAPAPVTGEVGASLAAW